MSQKISQFTIKDPNALEDILSNERKPLIFVFSEVKPEYGDGAKTFLFQPPHDLAAVTREYAAAPNQRVLTELIRTGILLENEGLMAFAREPKDVTFRGKEFRQARFPQHYIGENSKSRVNVFDGPRMIIKVPTDIYDYVNAKKEVLGASLNALFSCYVYVALDFLRVNDRQTFAYGGGDRTSEEAVVTIKKAHGFILGNVE